MPSTDRKLGLKAKTSVAQTASQTFVYVKGLTSALDGVQGQRLPRSLYPRERPDTSHGLAPGLIRTGAGNLAPMGFDLRPSTPSKSLYRLRYSIPYFWG
jgi:hypothetical protein